LLKNIVFLENYYKKALYLYNNFIGRPLAPIKKKGIKNMRIIAKLIVGLLCTFGIISLISYFYGFSIYFPFNIGDEHTIPDHRLHSVRLATFGTFIYFGIRYIFFTSTKLYPSQFLAVFLFNLGFLGGICFYINNVDPAEYLLVPFYIIVSIILFNVSKPQFRSYFKKK